MSCFILVCAPCRLVALPLWWSSVAIAGDTGFFKTFDKFGKLRKLGTMIRKLSKIEKFVVHSLLFHCSGDAIDTAYKLTRRNETKATDPHILHKMALRWLRDDESINNYIQSLGYMATIAPNGEKDFVIDPESDIFKITDNKKIKRYEQDNDDDTDE